MRPNMAPYSVIPPLAFSSTSIARPQLGVPPRSADPDLVKICSIVTAHIRENDQAARPQEFRPRVLRCILGQTTFQRKYFDSEICHIFILFIIIAC